MDDLPLMRVLHRVADLAEQLEPRVDVQRALVAEAVDRRALHVLHHEVRTPVGSHAAVEQPRDAGVLERGEDLPLLLEAARQDVARAGPRRTSLSATRLRNAPSSRSARYTTPMPPAPRLAR